MLINFKTKFVLMETIIVKPKNAQQAKEVMNVLKKGSHETGSVISLVKKISAT